jgi:hypothetical protein
LTPGANSSWPKALPYAWTDCCCAFNTARLLIEFAVRVGKSYIGFREQNEILLMETSYTILKVLSSNKFLIFGVRIREDSEALLAGKTEDRQLCSPEAGKPAHNYRSLVAV